VRETHEPLFFYKLCFVSFFISISSGRNKVFSQERIPYLVCEILRKYNLPTCQIEKILIYYNQHEGKSFPSAKKNQIKGSKNG
jgi:hypothetical protein